MRRAVQFIALLISIVLLSTTAFASRYVPYGRQYENVNDYFESKYNRDMHVVDEPLMRTTVNARYGMTDASYGDYTRIAPLQSSYPQGKALLRSPEGYLIAYEPYPIQRTQPSYFRMNAPAQNIAEGSYDDGFNRGYFVGYYDGVDLADYGYEAYYDYIEAMKDRYDPQRRTGYYQLADKQVQIKVNSVSNEYDDGFEAGIIEGFKDGFYGVRYNGENQDYYSYVHYQDTHPGIYTPISFRPKAPFNSFPNYASYSAGSKYYGFNY